MIETKVTGIIKAVGVTKQVTDTFSKRSLLLDTGHGYNPLVCIDFTQSRMAELDNFKAGQKVEVSLDIFSRAGKKNPNQYFHNILGWRIVSLEQTQAAAPPQKTAEPVENDVNSDELPF